MKKLLLSMLVLATGTSLIADMKINTATRKFYSIPESPYVDQAEYHRLAKKLFKIFKQCCEIHGIDIIPMIKTMPQVQLMNHLASISQNNPIFEQKLNHAFYTYLATIGTPTAERLLMDGVKGYVFGLKLN